MVTAESAWPVTYTPQVEEQVEKFVKFGAVVGIKVEPFQEQIVREIFSGREEVVVLLPRGNGKTTLMALVALYHLMTHPSPKVYCAAAARHQAKILWDETVRLAKVSKAVQKKITKFNFNELVTGTGYMRIVSADAMTAQGLDPTLAFCDELHAHKTPKLYAALKLSLKKPEACLCTISSAGYYEEGTLGQMRKRFLSLPDRFEEGRLRFIPSEESNSSFFEWAIWDDDDPDDMSIVKMANPASFMSEAKLRRSRHDPGVTFAEFLIFRCNRWAKIAGEGWLAPGAWRSCMEAEASIPEGANVTLGVDIGLKSDSSAVVVLWRRDDGRVVVKAMVWTPIGDGSAIEGALIMQAIRDVAVKYQVQAVAFDPFMFQIPAQQLMAEGLPMVEFPMTNGRTVPATATLRDAIESKVICHDGDPELTAHVEGGKLYPTERGVRLSKKSKHQIDALMAMLMGYGLLAGTTEGYADHGLRWFSTDPEADDEDELHGWG